MTGKQRTTKKKEIENTDDLIFALDIGTRTIVGIVGYYEKDIFKVVAAEVLEHKSRAMLDGQIHDIGMVSEVVSEVKQKLEKDLGIGLQKVAIAAAGRVLRTSQVTIEYEMEQGQEITAELVGSLEVDAIQKAQNKLDTEYSNEERLSFYCVGYSVVNYFLNGYVISSLVGHKGNKIGVEVLATFLPHIVVDSLYTVMSRVGLEVVSLTLEPIAAISVTIPKDLRLLNLVLVDIGAGTSDIAVTKDGSVVAYGMVPIAGDEITEKIANEYLVDFNTAEKIKLAVSSGTEIVKFTNILGQKNEINNIDILIMLKPTIELLAKSICDKITEFNQKPPNAVFLIGGGSQIPGLTERIAEGLNLKPDRVAIRGRDVIHNIRTRIKKLSGPESITPFGIAMMAYIQKGQDFMLVTVNGQKIRLFNSKKLTVADALILSGFNPDMLIGRSGKGLKFKLNGNQVFVKGGHGMAAEIYVNSINASLETPIKAGDNIDVKPAINGKDAKKFAYEYLNNSGGLIINYNGDQVELCPKIIINGKESSASSVIKQGDNIFIEEIKTLGDFALKFELDTDKRLLVNGEEKSLDYIIQQNDNVLEYDMLEKDKNELSQVEVEAIKNEDKNNEIMNFPIGDSLFYINVNGKKIILKENKPYIFVDIFNYINFDLSKPKGNIVLKLNGGPANFTDQIKSGDSIEIYWDK